MKAARPARLNISATPFRSSNLAIPPSPFSPRLPLSPPCTPSTIIAHPKALKLQMRIKPSVPPPKRPLNWVWQCHVCHIRYPLSVTRRCLEDGHFFCAGTTVVRTKRGKNGERTRVIRRHKACSSEFDYQGWKAWGDWRRNEQRMRDIVCDLITPEQDADDIGASTLGLGLQWQMRKLAQLDANSTHSHKDCCNKCDYPSECRWGAQAQQKSPSTSSSEASPPPVIDTDEAMTLPDTAPAAAEVTDAATTFDGILENIDGSTQQPQNVESQGKEASSAMDTILSALRLSASRRRNVGAPSPLATPVFEEDSDGSCSTASSKSDQDAGGDTVMGGVDLPAIDRELVLAMPSTPPRPTFTRGFEQDIAGLEGRKNPDQGKKDKKKGYIAYVDTLRKMGR